MKNLKRNKIALALVAVSALGVAVVGVAGIKDTKHNLGISGTGTNHMKAGVAGTTSEICVFCHTPHGGDNTAPVPLWNRDLPEGSSFTTYDTLGTTSFDGDVVEVGSVSIACLSCHDGSTALDVMLNEPGSGADSTEFVSGATYSTRWDGLGTDGKLTGIANLGTDLSNDHPIGMEYAGGLKSGAWDFAGTNTSSAFRDSDFRTLQGDKINGFPSWWVDTACKTTSAGIGSNGGVSCATATSLDGERQKTDMQLYTRKAASLGGASGAVWVKGTSTDADAAPFVECATCHDPHSENLTFLRADNFGSGVCLACHTK